MTGIYIKQNSKFRKRKREGGRERERAREKKEGREERRKRGRKEGSLFLDPRAIMGTPYCTECHSQCLPKNITLMYLSQPVLHCRILSPKLWIEPHDDLIT